MKQKTISEIINKYLEEFNKILIGKNKGNYGIVENVELRYSDIDFNTFLKGITESFEVNLILKTTRFSFECAHGFISKFSGNCGIAILNKAYVEPYFQNLGIGSLMHKLRIDIAKELGYSLLICTDIEDNILQEKILNKNGWKIIYKFTNKRTGNRINVNVLELNNEN